MTRGPFDNTVNPRALASGGSVDKWIGPARARMEKKGTVGSLHKALGVPQGDKIPGKMLSTAKAKAEHAGNTKMIRKITFAENVRK